MAPDAGVLTGGALAGVFVQEAVTWIRAGWREALWGSELDQAVRVVGKRVIEQLFVSAARDESEAGRRVAREAAQPLCRALETKPVSQALTDTVVSDEALPRVAVAPKSLHLESENALEAENAYRRLLQHTIEKVQAQQDQDCLRRAAYVREASRQQGGAPTSGLDGAETTALDDAVDVREVIAAFPAAMRQAVMSAAKLDARLAPIVVITYLQVLATQGARLEVVVQEAAAGVADVVEVEVRGLRVDLEEYIAGVLTGRQSIATCFEELRQLVTRLAQQVDAGAMLRGLGEPAGLREGALTRGPEDALGLNDVVSVAKAYATDERHEEAADACARVADALAGAGWVDRAMPWRLQRAGHLRAAGKTVAAFDAYLEVLIDQVESGEVLPNPPSAHRAARELARRSDGDDDVQDDTGNRGGGGLDKARRARLAAYDCYLEWLEFPQEGLVDLAKAVVELLDAESAGTSGASVGASTEVTRALSEYAWRAARWLLEAVLVDAPAVALSDQPAGGSALEASASVQVATEPARESSTGDEQRDPTTVPLRHAALHEVAPVVARTVQRIRELVAVAVSGSTRVPRSPAAAVEQDWFRVRFALADLGDQVHALVADARARRLSDPRLQVLALARAGRRAAWTGNLKEAAELYEEAVSAAAHSGEHEEARAALASRQRVDLRAGQVDRETVGTYQLWRAVPGTRSVLRARVDARDRAYQRLRERDWPKARLALRWLLLESLVTGRLADEEEAAELLGDLHDAVEQPNHAVAWHVRAGEASKARAAAQHADVDVVRRVVAPVLPNAMVAGGSAVYGSLHDDAAPAVEMTAAQRRAGLAAIAGSGLRWSPRTAEAIAPSLARALVRPDRLGRGVGARAESAAALAAIAYQLSETVAASVLDSIDELIAKVDAAAIPLRLPDVVLLLMRLLDAQPAQRVRVLDILLTLFDADSTFRVGAYLEQVHRTSRDVLRNALRLRADLADQADEVSIASALGSAAASTGIVPAGASGAAAAGSANSGSDRFDSAASDRIRSGNPGRAAVAAQGEERHKRFPQQQALGTQAAVILARLGEEHAALEPRVRARLEEMQARQPGDALQAQSIDLGFEPPLSSVEAAVMLRLLGERLDEHMRHLSALAADTTDHAIRRAGALTDLAALVAAADEHKSAAEPTTRSAAGGELPGLTSGPSPNSAKVTTLSIDTFMLAGPVRHQVFLAVARLADPMTPLNDWDARAAASVADPFARYRLGFGVGAVPTTALGCLAYLAITSEECDQVVQQALKWVRGVNTSLREPGARSLATLLMRGQQAAVAPSTVMTTIGLLAGHDDSRIRALAVQVWLAAPPLVHTLGYQFTADPSRSVRGTLAARLLHVASHDTVLAENLAVRLRDDIDAQVRFLATKW